MTIPTTFHSHIIIKCGNGMTLWLGWSFISHLDYLVLIIMIYSQVANLSMCGILMRKHTSAYDLELYITDSVTGFTVIIISPECRCYLKSRFCTLAFLLFQLEYSATAFVQD